MMVYMKVVELGNNQRLYQLYPDNIGVHRFHIRIESLVEFNSHRCWLPAVGRNEINDKRVRPDGELVSWDRAIPAEDLCTREGAELALARRALLQEVA